MSREELPPPQAPAIEWRFGPGAKRAPAWRRWTRRVLVLGGLGGAITGVVLAVQFMNTPAILLEPPLSAYAATHTASGALPVDRTGLWIEIPSLSIALPVRAGDGSNNIPDWVALHFPGTADPGDVGNSYLYAHGLRGMFGTLLLARDGEAVMLHNYSTGSVRTMHISRVVGRAAYNDTSWIDTPSAVPMLTLQTCIGAELNTDRWIVEAT